MVMKGRVYWLDILKGIGMLAVILGHTLVIPGPMLKYIYTFHMPLFFFVSGYLFTASKFAKLKDFLKKRSFTLLIPYFVFSIPAYGWWFVEWRSGEHPDISLIKPILGTFLAIRNTDWTSHTGTLWFIICLFVTELLFFFILKLTKQRVSYILLSLIGCTVAGCLYSTYVDAPAFWNIDASFMVILFYGLGYLAKQHGDLFKRLTDIKWFIPLLAVNAAAGMWNRKIDIFAGIYGNYALAYISACAGVVAMAILSMQIRQQRILQYIGQNTLVILIFHPFILAIVRKIVTLPSELSSYTAVGIGLAYMVLAIVICVPAIYIINRFFPYFIGRKPPSIPMKNTSEGAQVVGTR